jgi:hypothetical protein
MSKDISKDLEENHIVQCVACGATLGSVKELRRHNNEQHNIGE